MQHSLSVRLESITTSDGCREHVALQNLVWGYGPSDAVPVHMLIAAAHNGGIVLGAYADDPDGTARMVGALFGIPALRQGQLIHLSHLLAVHPQWRGRGIGAALKWRQRELVLAQGITTITWTYSPLEAVNAHLNLSRLGGTVRDYVRDYYGPMSDALNRGIPSDRFVVNWDLDSPRVQARAAGQLSATIPPDTPIALAAVTQTDGLPHPGPFTMPHARAALVEIPATMSELRQRDPRLRLAWVLAVRDAFETLFAAGYVAVETIRRDGRVFYYVEQEPSL